MVLLGAIVLAACVGGVIYYLIADQEHGVNSDTQVAQVCALGRQVGFPVLIRPIDTETSTIRLAIDRGPCGLLPANGGVGDPAGPCARQHLDAAPGKTASWEQTIKVVGDKTKDAFGVGEEEEEEGGGEEGSEEHTDDGVGKHRE